MKKKKLLKRIEELENIIEKEVFKNLHPPTLSDLENMKYHHDSILFKKYCKECELPMKQKVEILEDISGIRIKYCFDIRKL